MIDAYSMSGEAGDYLSIEFSPERTINDYFESIGGASYNFSPEERDIMEETGLFQIPVVIPSYKMKSEEEAYRVADTMSTSTYGGLVDSGEINMLELNKITADLALYLYDHQELDWDKWVPGEKE